jgi:hypothetical protein
MKRIIILVLFTCSTIYSNPQIINTLAGNGTAGYCGDGGV